MTPKAIRTGSPVPAALVLPAAAGVVLIVGPLLALAARAEWSSFWADISTPTAQDALRLSVGTALIATAVCLALGFPLALVIARARPAVAAVLRVTVTVPLVLPPMIGGVALLFLLGRRGALGAPLFELWGIQIPFTTTAVVIAQVFVALPFLVLTVESSLRTVGTDLERTAETLGAGPWRILFRITLPLAAPGVISGTVLCFARAIGEFGATALFAGNAPGTTQTMPLAIYTAFNGSGVGQGEAVALSLLLLATTVMMLVLVRAWRPGAAR